MAWGTPAGRGPAGVRSDQGLGTRPAGAADAGISEGAGGEPRRSEEWRPGQLASRRFLPAARHAGHDDAFPADGSDRAAGDDLYPHRSHPRVVTPNLYRRTRLAKGTHRTDVRGLLDRQVD